MPRPDEATLNTFIVALENTLDAQARQSPDPGFKPVHRLNRTEYGNAGRDILDLDVDVTDLLPADDESYGFDNIAACCACRRRSSSSTCRPRTRSAAWR
jgi:hypothetical protein